MAQSNFEERIDTYEIESTNVMTGDRDRSRYLYYQLKMSMAKAKRMTIRFLKASGKGFFVEKAGCALALRDEIGDVIGNMAFGEQMGDVLGYRSLEYYRRRYEENRWKQK